MVLLYPKVIKSYAESFASNWETRGTRENVEDCLGNLRQQMVYIISASILLAMISLIPFYNFKVAWKEEMVTVITEPVLAVKGFVTLGNKQRVISKWKLKICYDKKKIHSLKRTHSMDEPVVMAVSQLSLLLFYKHSYKKLHSFKVLL